MSRKAVLVFIICSATLLPAQQAPKSTVNKVPASYTSPASGPEMYQSYCSSCHGANAKGHGPAAPALKAAPTDLTVLAKANKGIFPAEHFATVLEGKAAVPAHGSREMPVWGRIFSRLSNSDVGEVQLRIFNLSQYVESLQQK